jgi:DNA-binding CsgD family transcriptional regulator
MPTSRVAASVEALISARRVDDAARLAQDSLARSLPADERAEVRLLLSSIRLMQGEPGEATVHADAVLAEAGLPESRYAAAQLARLLGLLAHGELAAARTPAEALLAGPTSAQTDECLAGAFTTMGSVAWTEGRVADSLTFFRAAVARAARGEVAEQALHPKQCLVVPLVALGRFDEAETLILQELAEVETHPDVGWSVGAWLRRARLELARGELGAAETSAGCAVHLADECGARLFVPMVRTTLATIALLDGDLLRTMHELDCCESEPPAARGQFASALGRWIEARVVDIERGPDLAMKVVADVYDNLPAHRRILLEEPAMGPWMVRTAMAASAASKAKGVASAAQLLADANLQHGCVAAIALHCDGLVRNDIGALTEAAARHTHPYARGAAFEDAARALAAAGDRGAARDVLEPATEAYVRSGAQRDASRTRRLRDDLSHRRNGVRALGRPVSGWGSLTETERRVAAEVVHGLTNADVGAHLHLSRHTVDFHLRQIFRKLGLHSRVELTRLALEASELES